MNKIIIFLFVISHLVLTRCSVEKRVETLVVSDITDDNTDDNTDDSTKCVLKGVFDKKNGWDD